MQARPSSVHATKTRQIAPEKQIGIQRRWLWPLGLATAWEVVTAGAMANPVLDWNVTALQTTRAAPFHPPLEARNLALVQLAVFDAINSLEHDFEPYTDCVRASPGAALDAAAAAAAHDALVHLYPEQRGALDATYDAALSRISVPLQAKAAGIAIGITASKRLLAQRSADGSTGANAVAYSSDARPGQWVPTPPALLAALAPGWDRVTPFALKTAAQYRPVPPPSLTSAEYAADFNEIREIGSVTSSVRTQAETELARFWIATGAQNWNPVARDVVRAQGLDILRSARVLALLNLAGADAFIAAWDAKFTYGQWRPITAIRAADTDGNPLTTADPSWTPLLVTPPFPDYIAGHTTYAGAAAAVLGTLFGDTPGVSLVLTNSFTPGFAKTYTSFREIAEDVVNARVYGGIHWRTSSVAGLRVGEQIGRYAVRHCLTPLRRK